jgi:uncharacterized C2H2 Zn-finger protein
VERLLNHIMLGCPECDHVWRCEITAGGECPSCGCIYKMTETITNDTHKVDVDFFLPEVELTRLKGSLPENLMTLLRQSGTKLVM